MSKITPFVALLLLSSSGVLHAQTPLQPQLSTRDEWRTCLKEEDDLKKQRSLLKEESKTHSANLKRVQDEMRAHVATQPRVGASDDAAVDSFNEKIELLNARVEASNKKAEQLNLDLYTLNTRIATANKRCAGMVVTNADYEAVKKERAEAAKAR